MKRSCLYSFLLLLAFYVIQPRSARAEWEPTNGPFANTITCFYADGSTFIAGTYTEMYRSEDEGAHWTRIPGQFSACEFCAVGKAIYAGTREHGVIASHDDGKTWEQVSNPSPENELVSSLIFHDGKLYAGTTFSSVYVSPDSGRTWTDLKEGLPDYYYNTQFAVANNKVFVGIPNDFGGTEGGIFVLDGDHWKPTALRNISGFSISVLGSRLIVGEYGVLYISDDDGATWTERRDNLPVAYIRTIVQSGSTLFAGTDGAGVWTSDDNGLTWSQNVLSRPRINLFAVTEKALVVGTVDEGVLTTSNSGVSWVHKNDGLQSTSSLSALFVDKNYLYAVNEITGAIFRSNDRGTTWQTLPSPSEPAIAIATYDGRIIIATRTGKIFSSANEGITWSEGNGNFEQLGFNTLIALDHTVLAGAYNGTIISNNTSSGLLFSEDAGASWSQADLPSHVYAFARHGERVFAGTPDGVFSSDDGGRHWTERNSTASPGDEVYALASNGTAVFTSFFHEGVYVSQNNGENWSRANGLPNNVRIDAFTTFEHYVFAGSANGIFMTADNGQSWEQIDPATELLFTVSLATDGTYLYAGTKNRAVWRRLLAEFAPTSVNEPVTLPTFLLYPQPMSDLATLTLCDDCAVRDAILTLTTLDGRLVFTQPQVHGRTIALHRKNLPAGTYMFTLAENAHIVASGVVIME